MLRFILALRATHKTTDKITEFELTLEKTNKLSMLCLWTDMFHCAWEERGHKTASWIFDHVFDFIHILILEVDFRNTGFWSATILAGNKIKLPSKQRRAFCICLCFTILYDHVELLMGLPLYGKRTLYMTATKSRFFQLLLLKMKVLVTTLMCCKEKLENVIALWN